jgi:hypothetical protein
MKTIRKKPCRKKPWHFIVARLAVATAAALLFAAQTGAGQSVKFNLLTTNANPRIALPPAQTAVFVSAANGFSPGERNNPMKPYASLAEATAAAQPGDVIWVKDGVFNEVVTTKPLVSFYLEDGVVINTPFWVTNHNAPLYVYGRGTFTVPPVLIEPVTNSSSYVQCKIITNNSYVGYFNAASNTVLTIDAEEVYANQPSIGGGPNTVVYVNARKASFGSLLHSDSARVYIKGDLFSANAVGLYGTNILVGGDLFITNAPTVNARLYILGGRTTNAAAFYAPGRTFGYVTFFSP